MAHRLQRGIRHRWVTDHIVALLLPPRRGPWVHRGVLDGAADGWVIGLSMLVVVVGCGRRGWVNRQPKRSLVTNDTHILRVGTVLEDFELLAGKDVVAHHLGLCQHTRLSQACRRRQ